MTKSGKRDRNAEKGGAAPEGASGRRVMGRADRAEWLDVLDKLEIAEIPDCPEIPEVLENLEYPEDLG